MKGVLSLHDFRRCGELVMNPGEPMPPEVADPVVSIDSRKVEEGGIFVALPGERTDGHRFVDDVFRRGARMVMVSREWYSASGSPLPPPGRGTLVVQDTVSGLQQLAAIYRESFSIPVVGVGGSNGKTTTKEMLGAVLSTAMRVHMSHANLNNHLGVPLTLLAMRRETEIAVVEMGINHPGEMELLTSIARPSHGLLTNIGHEHLEFLVNLDGVARAERALFSFLDETGGTIFVNNDDPRLRDAATDPQRHILYGMHCGDCCSCRGGALSVLPDGSLRFMLYSERGDEEIRLNFTGRHNVLNALAAATVGIFFGIEPREVRRGLEGLVPREGWKRLEVVSAGGVTLLNDTYNANPDSMRLAIDALLDMPCQGRRIAVIGDMLELGDAGPGEHEAMGKYLAGSSVDMIFSFGELAGSICFLNPGRCRGHFTSREKLFDALSRELEEGDTVLFKGSRGMKLEETVTAILAARTINS
ncbi:UDP-N-acetylmuramoyl-tripeptide--D-alanyl-D-alanine ligase [Chlorobium phaeovibrioides]|uniref:UDP-N-acetylmuramoyl-tripeptide--D-alanyl-D-alanine ligase n=1 Tax=Chlorobium phaeovibrioides TaxID=1094 RepID=A0ABW9UN58_CHLPH|nr:UDP-N-acetylmuramoyl-tripeptide--D-alanyl-D-alanine ligase [Chlorobium phaeovibrioides]